MVCWVDDVVVVFVCCRIVARGLMEGADEVVGGGAVVHLVDERELLLVLFLAHGVELVLKPVEKGLKIG